MPLMAIPDALELLMRSDADNLAIWQYRFLQRLRHRPRSDRLIASIPINKAS